MIDVEKFVRAMKPSAMTRRGIRYVDCMNGRSDNFFAWGGGAMSHALVLLIEDDCAA